MLNLSIKRALPEHLLAILELMQEFAKFEDLQEYFEVTEEKLVSAMFDVDSFVEGLVAFDGETPIGYAIFFPYFSSFRGQKSVYLEDLYVTLNFRKSGIGEKMLKEVARVGKESGAVRMDFQVLDWNKNAIKFYRKHGVEIHESERHLCFTGTAFEKLTSKT